MYAKCRENVCSSGEVMSKPWAAIYSQQAQQPTDGTEPKIGFRPCTILVPWGADRKSLKASTKSNQNLHYIFPYFTKILECKS